MVSCLLTPSENLLIMRMFKKKARLQQEALSDPSREQAHLLQRNLIVQFVLTRLGPALEARIKTWTARKLCDEADAESQVYEHVLLAVDKYRPEKGNCKFTSLLWTISNRAFSNFMKAAKRQKRDPQSASVPGDEGALLLPIDTISASWAAKTRRLVSLSEGTAYLGGETLTLADTVSDRTQEGLELHILIDATCTDQQRVLLTLLQQNYTYREIADQIGSTSGVVSRQIRELRKKLKHELKNFRSYP